MSQTVTLDLKLLSQPPDFSQRAQLTIEALAPLSMVTSMPGKYYRSQPAPTAAMLYGLIENALGWHISDGERKQLIKQLERKHQVKFDATDVGYASLLQCHLRFTTSYVPALLHYDDLWAQHLKMNNDIRHINGSRNYDFHAIPTLNAAKASESEPPVREIFRYFPQYYISPTPRGYVVPQSSYRFLVETSAHLAQLICDGFDAPAAPLYLGSNDGWVDAKWEIFS